MGTIPVRNSKNPVRIRITREDRRVSFESSGRSFTSLFDNLPDDGYFSFFALTSQQADATDLYSFRTASLSRLHQQGNVSELDRVNRKFLQANIVKRRFLKEKRRAKMVITNDYLDQLRDSRGVLNEKHVNLRDALLIVKETEERSKEMVTIGELLEFVDKKISVTIHKALHKVNLAAERFDDTKLDLSGVWSSLRTQLLSLSAEAKITMTQMGAEAVEAARAIQLKRPDLKEAKMAVSGAAAENGVALSRILQWISVLELFAYVIFFFVKRRQTHGFKKID
jgi:hypothetical protein